MAKRPPAWLCQSVHPRRRFRSTARRSMAPHRTLTSDNPPMDRILGIVGGTGPESTADYYRSLIAIWRERGPADTFPRVIINSVEGGAIIRLLGAGDYRAVGAALSVAVRQLASA